MHDPKLVEALARLLHEIEDLDVGWDNLADYERDSFLNDARAFFDTHRLVQLLEILRMIDEEARRLESLGQYASPGAWLVVRRLRARFEEEADDDS